MLQAIDRWVREPVVAVAPMPALNQSRPVDASVERMRSRIWVRTIERRRRASASG
jgi:hypothetical protein